MKKEQKAIGKSGIRIAVLGSINRDIVAQATRLPKVGETVDGTGLSMFTGGKGANQAAQAALLDAEVFFIGCTGDDEHAPIVTQSLADTGVNTELLLWLEGGQTGNCSIFVSETGDNMIVYYPGTNHMVSHQHLKNATKVIQSSDLFMAQLEVNLDAVERGLQIAREAGIPTLLNPAPAHPLTDAIFKLVDYITPNETESERYTGLLRSDMPIEEWKQRNAQWFLDKGVKAVCITLGGEGVYYSDGSTELSAPAFEIDPVDTTAAGDAFNAGFAYGIAAKWDIKRTLRLGNACGALAASKLGAFNSLCARPLVDEFLETR